MILSKYLLYWPTVFFRVNTGDSNLIGDLFGEGEKDGDLSHKSFCFPKSLPGGVKDLGGDFSTAL